MKSSKNVLDSSNQLNISEMIQYGEEHININVRYFVKCRDYTELITHLMNIMNAFNEKKRLENRGKFVKLIIDFESINISSFRAASIFKNPGNIECSGKINDILVVPITTIVNNGLIRCGYGGGGGGSGAGNDPSDKSSTDYGRSGAGGGGGAGLPAGSGGAAGSGGFNGDQPINGGPGFAGSLDSGGGGGTAGSEGGAVGGPGGAGGDFNDAPVNGTVGQRTDDRAYTNTPGPLGPAGTDGRAVIFSSNSIQQNSSFTGNSVGGRNGGAEIGGFD